MRKITALLLSVSLTLVLFAAALSVNAAEYSDTATHWGKKAIDEWSGYGVVQGSDGKFRPNDPITRAEMATVIAKLLKLNDKGENTFTDLPASAWFTENVLKCAKVGIINGYSDKTFRPNNKITRQEAMVMLGRALGIKEDKSISLAAFKDASTVASWAEGYVKSMVNRKIVNGVSADTLALSANINRASVVTILSNAIDEYVTAPGSVEVKASDTGITLIVVSGVTVVGEKAGDVYLSPAASSNTGAATDTGATSGGTTSGGTTSGGGSGGGSGGSGGGGISPGGQGGDADSDTPIYNPPEVLPNPKDPNPIIDENGETWTPLF